MIIPSYIFAASWIPYCVAVLIVLVFSLLYIRYFQHKYDKELCSSVTSILSLSVCLVTCALIPVDIFLVSYMKDSDGSFKDWAKNETDRQYIMDMVLYAYYSMYGLEMVFTFFLLPFSYFYYEEGDEDGEVSTKSRICRALGFTSVFIIMAVVLLLIGTFVPFRGLPPNFNGSMSDWEKIENLFGSLGKNRGENAISFTISVMMLIGLVFSVVYTGYGMSAWPMDLVKGRRSIHKERQEVEEDRDTARREIEEIRSRYPAGRRISRSDRRRIDDLEERADIATRRDHFLETAERSCLRKCGLLCRPFEVVIGVVCFLFAALVFISLLLTNIDKLMHSLGPDMGYILANKTLPNPLDITLVFAQKVFPLDYIILCFIVLYFFLCSMSGIQSIGICCCCFRMFKIRVHRTKPQGLLFLCFLLMFIVMALNIILYQITPQYIMYGPQHYVTANNTLKACNIGAPANECIMSRMGMLVTRFCYKIWFFGTAYFWLSWALLAVFLIGFVVALIRKRRSHVEGAVETDDILDSDEELLTP